MSGGGTNSNPGGMSSPGGSTSFGAFGSPSSFGNFDPSQNYFPPMDFSQVSQFLQSPYQPYMPQQAPQTPPMQPPQAPPTPQVPYYQQQQGQQQSMSQPQQPLSADQTFLNNFNQSKGTNYSAMSQLPANDYQNYLQSAGQLQQQGQTQSAPAPQQSPYAKSGLQATFAPPAYPTWLYGPTAGAFGGVTRPQGTPQNYGYFPGTGQWGAQPIGSNFNAG